MSINQVNISGNLTQDSTLSVLPNNNTSVLNFNVAVNENRYNAQTNTYDDYCHFFNCFLFGKRAESLEKWLTKGTKVFINGSLSYSSWQDKETGKKRSTIKIKVNNIDFMSKSSSQQNANNNPQQPTEPASNQKIDIEELNWQPIYADEDIPF